MTSIYGIVQIKLVFTLIILMDSFFVFLSVLKPMLSLPFALLQPYQLFSFFLFISSRYFILPYHLDARFLLFLFLFSRLWIPMPYACLPVKKSNVAYVHTCLNVLRDACISVGLSLMVKIGSIMRLHVCLFKILQWLFTFLWNFSGKTFFYVVRLKKWVFKWKLN